MANSSSGNKILPVERLWLCMIFLFAISLFNKGGYLLMGLVVWTCLLYFHSIRIDVTAVCLILFSVSYAVISILQFGFSFTDFCNHLIGPWGAYLVGKCYVRRYSHGQPLFRLMLAVSLGFFLHGALNLWVQLFVYFDPRFTFRLAYDIWHGRYVSTTGVGLLYTLMLGFSFGLLFSETKRRWKLLGFVGIGISLLYSFVLAHRTTTVLILLVALFYLIRRLVKGHRPTRKYILFLLCSFFTVLFFLVCLLFDMFGLRSWLISQSLYMRLTNPAAANSGSRVAIWLSFLRQFWQHPAGGAGFPLAWGASYAHNMWFDVYYRCGLLPFLLLMGASCSVLHQIWLTVQCGTGVVSPLTQNCLLFLSWAFVLNAFVEPVMDANPYFLFGYLMIAGGLAGLRPFALAGGGRYDRCSDLEFLQSPPEAAVGCTVPFD